MTGRFARIIAACVILYGAWPEVIYAQGAPPPPAAAAADQFNTEQVDALVAPIALYPDTLLTQILMASTYPLQIVQAARWGEDPKNKGLTGDALVMALEPQPWDPSVKSLVPFPQVLAMMNGNVDWMQQLGYAFADQQASVMDSVQRLRRQAQGSGSLQTTPEQVVRTEQQYIYIEPAQPNVVYVPNYNPTVVYGSWPYPAYPPVYVSPYPLGGALAAGIAFGIGVGIVGGLWGWASPRWGVGNVNVNVNRYNNINVNNIRVNRANAVSSGTWQPNRANGRPAGLSRPPGGPVGGPARPSTLPTNAIGRGNVSVPGSVVRPGAGAAAGRPGAGQRPAARPAPGGQPGRAGLPAPGNRPSTMPARPAPDRGAFSGMNDGSRASQFGQRGAQSRSFQQPSGRSPGASSGARGGGGGGGARAGGGCGGRR
jgi:hypothetical protein